MLHPLRLRKHARACPRRTVGSTAAVVLFCLASVPSLAQQPPVHFIHPAGMPPGAIGSQQLQRGGPLPGFFQPVEIRAPDGVLISLAEGGRFAPAGRAPIRAGLLIGQVYRLRVMNLPLQPGVEIFPTIEVVDRIYAPRGQELRFPIIIDLAKDDLDMAMAGKFVTRVVYLEDPENALPVREAKGDQGCFDVPATTDPLVVADTLGRPVAIVRMGARMPDGAETLDAAFLFGCPPWVKHEPRPVPPVPPQASPATKTKSPQGGRPETPKTIFQAPTTPKVPPR